MSEQHYLVIDIDDPQRDGCYSDFDSVAKQSFPYFFEKEGEPIKFRPVRRSDALDGAPWADVNTQSAEIHATVGLPGQVLAGIGTADFSSDADGVISVVNRQTGTATKRSVQRIHIDNHVVPTDGNIIINFNKPEIVQVACLNNKGVKQKFVATFNTADVAGDHHLGYDDYEDISGPVRVWFDNGSGGGPVPTPAGGRLIHVVYVIGDSAIALATKFNTAINADAVFGAVATPVGSATTTLTETHAGPRAVPTVGSGTLGISYAVTTAGAAGSLSGKTFKLFDLSGSVGVWFQAGSALAPIAAGSCDRNIAVPVTNDDTSATVASAVATAIDADAQFTASVVGGTTTVLVTDVTGGDREDAVDIDSLVGIKITQHGKGLTYNGLFSAKTSLISSALEGYFTITRLANNDIDFKAVDVGAQPAITVDASDIEFPNVIFGILPLNTPEMATYFTAQLLLDANLLYVSLFYELKIGFPSQDLNTVFRVAVRVYRTIFDNGVLPVPSGGTWGRTNIGNGSYTVAVVFGTALASANWHFAGLPTVVNLIDAPSLNLTASTVTARSAAGFTIQLSGPTDSANYKLEWIVVMD